MEKKSTILVVDDIPENIDLLHGVLSRDYKVKVAPNGVKALEIAQSDGPPDLILLDIMMPGIDGYEVCKKLKADRKTQGIPVIFVTAKTDIDDETKGFECGAVDYITKPISPPKVKARVATHLKLRKAELDLRQLVEKTLGGAIEVLIDILSVANPTAFSRASRLKRHVTGLMAVADLNAFWQIRMAAMLSQIGCITVSPETIERIYRGQEVSPEERETYNRHPQVGYELIRKIPKMTEVAEIIVRQQVLETDTGFRGSESAQQVIRTGSRMLKLTLEYEQFIFRGYTPAAALTEIEAAPDDYGDDLLKNFARIVEREPAHVPVRQVFVRDLQPGMIIDMDIFTKKGNLLVKAGTEVSVPVFETLHNFSKTGFIQEPFQVLVPA